MTSPGDTALTGQQAEIPLFPLNVVLFPEGPLPLRIFESRYVDMIGQCMRGGSVFGVVLTFAREAGATAEPIEIAAVGTSARIVDFHMLRDGLLGISCLGERRFRVCERRRQSDGLELANVEWLAPESAATVPEDLAHLAQLAAQIVGELGEVYQHVPRRLEDAGWVGCRLAEVLPFQLPDRQRLLELEDPLERLARIAPLIRRRE